jgi:hypothetical protein
MLKYNIILLMMRKFSIWFSIVNQLIKNNHTTIQTIS